MTRSQEERLLRELERVTAELEAAPAKAAEAAANTTDPLARTIRELAELRARVTYAVAELRAISSVYLAPPRERGRR